MTPLAVENSGRHGNTFHRLEVPVAANTVQRGACGFIVVGVLGAGLAPDCSVVSLLSSCYESLGCGGGCSSAAFVYHSRR